MNTSNAKILQTKKTRLLINEVSSINAQKSRCQIAKQMKRDRVWIQTHGHRNPSFIALCYADAVIDKSIRLKVRLPLNMVLEGSRKKSLEILCLQTQFTAVSAIEFKADELFTSLLFEMMISESGWCLHTQGGMFK